MEIQVNRFVSDSDTTISLISVDGRFVCFGLEDEFREDKVSNETRIPAGQYNIGLRTEGGFHQKYSRRYPNMHKGMLHLQDVPGFEWILIHCGNTDEDTSGCLLVGAQANTIRNDMSIMSSRLAYENFYPIVVDAAMEGNLSITIVDNDR